MKHISLIILLVIALVCCKQNQQPAGKTVIATKNGCFIYPTVINSLNMQALYDSARWYVYTWHCTDIYIPKNDTSKNFTYGQIGLSFDKLNFKQDTIEIKFNFLDGNQPILTSMSKNYMELVTGVAFDLKTKKKVYMISPHGFSITVKGNTSRYENPLQPEVLKYLKKNWDKLNDCFREIAVQKGIKP